MRTPKLLLALCLAAGLCGPALLPAAAQAGLQVEAFPAPDYTFGIVATFRVAASSDADIRDVTLFYRAEPAAETIAAPAIFTPGQAVNGLVTLDLAQNPLPPFARVDYWWDVQDQAGRRATTPPQTFHYTDNRFTWQAQSQGSLTVHWYYGDKAFGQRALSAAVTGLTQARLTAGAVPSAALDIYIYANTTDAQEALRPAAGLWVEGRADPALNLAIVTVVPGLEASRDLGREVPHEVMHLLLAQRLGAGYSGAPSWLSEGLAVMNQAQPDPEFAQALSRAREAEGLYPLAILCGPFPADPVQAQLAYAQSESVVRYLRRHYPAASLARMLDAYAQGAGCEAGVAQGLGLSLDELEQAWRADLSAATPAAPLLPWVILAAVVLLGGVVLALLTLSGRRRQA